MLYVVYYANKNDWKLVECLSILKHVAFFFLNSTHFREFNDFIVITQRPLFLKYFRRSVSFSHNTIFIREVLKEHEARMGKSRLCFIEAAHQL